MIELRINQALDKHIVSEIGGEKLGSKIVQKGMEDASGVGKIENREGEEVKATPRFPCQVYQEVSQTTRAKGQGTTHRDEDIKRVCLALKSV